MNLTVDIIFAETKEVDTKSLRLKKISYLEFLVKIRFFSDFFSKLVIFLFTIVQWLSQLL